MPAHSQTSTAAIVAAGRRLLEERGKDALTMRDVADAGSPRAQARQRRLAARAVPRHQHQPRAQAGQTLGRDLADSGGAAGHHHDLAVHAPSLYRLGAPRASSKMTIRP